MLEPYVNICMVTFNRLEFTKQSIESIKKHTYFPYVITVVDNASQDGTQKYLKELHQNEIIKNIILLDQNVGVAKASNLAWLQELEAFYYLKYDNNIVIQKDGWLSDLIRIIDTIPELGAIGYNFEPVSYPLKTIRGNRIRVKEEGNIGGACFLIPKRTERLLGYWCESYGLYGFEDVDYSLRIKLAGLLNAYIEDEDIGLHLPAGKAPKVAALTWSTTDEIEEVKYKHYRDFKDIALRESVTNGLIQKNLKAYVDELHPLYVSSIFSFLPKNPNGQLVIDAINTCSNCVEYQPKIKLLRVDIGCGTNKPNNFVGVDIYPGIGVDIVADINRDFPFPNSSVDELRAHDIIEHLSDRIHTMNEIWRVCKPGAKVSIRVPSTDGRGAFQDPTHVSFWNINSFLYYCSEFPSYIELCRRYGFSGEFQALKLEHEESPDGVIHVLAELSVVKPVSNSITNQSDENNLTRNNEYQQKPLEQATAEENTLNSQPSDFFSRLSMYVQQYQQDPTNRSAIANLRQVRYQIATQWLSQSATQSKKMYIGELGRAHQVMLSSGIKNESLTDIEKTFLNEVTIHVSRGFDEPKALQYILAAMLYRRAEQLPLQHDISSIPQWLLNDYLNFLFCSPAYFQEVGEANSYYSYLKQWIQYLHTSIFSASDSQLWRNIATQFLRLANFIPL